VVSSAPQVTGSLLSSFKALEFWPDCTEAILVEAKLRPAGTLSPAEQALATEVEAKVRRGNSPWSPGWVCQGCGHNAVNSKPKARTLEPDTLPYSHVMIGRTKKLLCFRRLEGLKNCFLADWKA
jgi:hypothetical protein